MTGATRGESGSAGESRARGASPWLWLGPPLLFGALLRLWGIQRQVLGGDEFHALQRAASYPLASILTHYDPQVDHSVPLTAWVRLALVGGLEPSELVLRIPVLLSGVALAPVLALAVWRLLGTRVACVFAWLLAISPLLVLYGRILRSYGPILVLAPLAVLAFHRWLEHGRRKDALIYALAAPLAAYFHLLAAIFVTAPLAWGLLSRPWRRGGPQPRALLGLAAGTGLVAAVCFAPVVASLLSFATKKSGRGVWQWSAAKDTAQLFAGVYSQSIAVLFLSVCALGALRLARSRPRLFSYLLFLCCVHVAALLVSRPAHYSEPLVFDRYMLVLLPIVLLLAACAFGIEPSGRSAGSATVANLLPVPFVALLFFGGPLTSAEFLHGSFTHHRNFLVFIDPRLASPPAGYAGSAFWSKLAREDGARAIVEYPVDHRWNRTSGFYFHQLVHGKEVLVSSDQALYCDRRLRWRNAVACEPAAYLESRADYLVVHVNPGIEEGHFSGNVFLQDPSWTSFTTRAQALQGTLRERWGAPAFEDAELAVWDLRQVRASAASRGSR